MSATNQPEPPRYTTVDLLRHGVCEGENLLKGSTDVALLPEGFEQMDEVAHYQSNWNRVISSPLKRCREFGERIAERRSLTLCMDERWREIDFGTWDGLEIETIRANFPEESWLYYTQPTKFTPPGAEPVLAFQQRVVLAFNELHERYRGEHLLVIQHGGTQRVLLAHILGMSLDHVIRISIPYACLTRIRIYHALDGNYPELVAHIPEPASE